MSFSPAEVFTSPITMFAPWEARVMAIARPRPEAPPVIRTVRSLRSGKGMSVARLTASEAMMLW